MLIPQAIDRSVIPNDVVYESIYVPMLQSDYDKWAATIAINKAILALSRRGGGPAHIDLETGFSSDFSVTRLPEVQKINRIEMCDDLPDLPTGRIGILVGDHIPWTSSLQKSVDVFCERTGAVVFYDLPGNYKGEYGVPYSIVCDRKYASLEGTEPELLIHIGEMSGGYALNRLGSSAKCVWRVNPDGEIRDKFKKLKYVFEMSEEAFFKRYTNETAFTCTNINYLKHCRDLYAHVYAKIPDMPFSNLWIASQVVPKIPENSALHLGILNTLRTWNYFDVRKTVTCFSNTGGFGIDGNTSSLLGAALANTKKLCFGIVGDLSFFYDMNSLGNRHIGPNFRLIIVNNGRGTEFRLNISVGSVFPNHEADRFIAAAGHYGQKSSNLIRHYAEDLGFYYMSASSKSDFLGLLPEFVSPEIGERPIIFEVFTNSEDEVAALQLMHDIDRSASGDIMRGAKSIISQILPKDLKNALKKAIH
jgi:2-succinyl-5-enolpyruvyl-6-hydroxy-3-cyclohexene-1-carboxylate synthase